MVYRAILIDIDGTLLDTLQDIADATNIALGKFGFPLHGIDTVNSRKILKYYIH
jgi:phosphoglycolate phosphatase